jgi:hypothetical protein
MRYVKFRGKIERKGWLSRRFMILYICKKEKDKIIY